MENLIDKRFFVCDRCGCVYEYIKGVYPTMCTAFCDHRTSGICGGQLIERDTKNQKH